MEIPQLLGGFKEKFDSFLKLYEKVKAENIELKEKNVILASQIQEKDKELESIRHAIETNKLAETFVVGIGNQREAKQEISKIVREIDNCIALLNR